MILGRILSGAVLVGSFVGLAGCADAHLGDLVGRRSRAVWDGQAVAKGGDSAGTLDADDAKAALARHRGRGAPGTPGAASGVSSGGGSYGMTGGGAAAGGMTSAGIQSSTPMAPIRLDAVR